MAAILSNPSSSFSAVRSPEASAIPISSRRSFGNALRYPTISAPSPAVTTRRINCQVSATFAPPTSSAVDVKGPIK